MTNRLNQYTSRTVPGAVDVLGIANPTPAVTVNGNTAYRHGEYFDYALPVSNGTAQYPTVSVVSAYGGTQTNSGNLWVPPATESFQYDLDGNLTQDGRWTYTWDGENRLITMLSLTNGPTGSTRWLRFVYDYQGRRIGKTGCLWTNAAWSVVVSNKFLYDGWNLVAELNVTNNTLIRSYVWGNDLSSSSQGAGGVGGLLKVTYSGSATTNAFVAYDGNGNVAGLLNAADSTWCAQYEHGPFGEAVRASGSMAKANPLRFSTKYQDDESDLLYYGYRYYNTGMGRWPNRDLIEEQGGLDLYGFVENNGVNGFDMLGLTIVCTAWSLGWPTMA